MSKTCHALIFDLDDTLIYYGKHKVVVPRQTFHKLKSLKYAGWKIAVISFHPWCPMVLDRTGLSKYVDFVSYGNKNRETLMADLLSQMPSVCHLHYYDDRIDNLLCIVAIYPNIYIHHVDSPLLLYHLLRDL
jgi:hypothetical protein